MAISSLPPDVLRITVAPESLGFSDTSELLQLPLPWIGQERAEIAARFGLGMEQPDYNLFVLGEVGSGRSTLLRQVMQEMAAHRAVPPDLCYLHNFDAPDKPRALRLPPGQGRLLRQFMAQMCKTLQKEIPQRLDGPDFKAESKHIEKTYKVEQAKAYAELDAFAEARSFALYRENGHLVFTLLGDKGTALTESEARSLPKERRARIDQAEQELREEITRFLDKTRPIERVMNEGLAALRRQVARPLLDREVQEIRLGLNKQIKDAIKLSDYLEQVIKDVLDNLELFQVSDEDDELRQEELVDVLSRYRVNLLVDNEGLVGAPVVIDSTQPSRRRSWCNGPRVRLLRHCCRGRPAGRTRGRRAPRGLPPRRDRQRPCGRPAPARPCRTSSPTARAALSSRSATTTRMPASANASAMPRPMPLPPPVTTATPSSRFFMLMPPCVGLLRGDPGAVKRDGSGVSDRL